MSSFSGKPTSELELEALSNGLRNSLTIYKEENGDKPDFRELETGSPVSPLRTRLGSGQAATTTSSSSSSSGSVSGRVSTGPNPHNPRKPNSSPNSHSGELSVVSSPSTTRNFRSGHTRSRSCGSHHVIFSGSGSVSSPPPASVAPTGNICPSGRILKTGMAGRAAKPEVLGSGSGRYGHGSIMRGGIASKPGPDGGLTGFSRGLMVGGEPVKKSGLLRRSNDPEELKRMGNDCYKNGHLAEALSLYEKAIAMSPTSAAYHFKRAAALMGLRRFVEAVRECEEAIRLDPNYVKAHHRLGSLLLRVKPTVRFLKLSLCCCCVNRWRAMIVSWLIVMELESIEHLTTIQL